MNIGRKILMSLVMTVVFFVLLEGLLAMVGVRAQPYADDPYVGFSSTSRLFVESSTGGGAELVTAEGKLALFNRQRFPVQKGRSYRIFCVGGSTTFGRPYDDATSYCGWLRELLPIADPDREWQVINAGGVSYASYRVALLMEELADYEPDLFIVYSGHNEFLERRSYPQIIAMPKTIRGLGSVAAKTRVWTAMSGLVGGLTGGPAAPENDPDILNEEVTTLLDSAVGPSAYSRDDQLSEKILEHYRFNLARMIDIAASVGAETMLVTPGSNLMDSRPFKSQPGGDLDDEDRRRIDEFVGIARTAHDDGRLDASVAAVDSAAGLDPRNAELAFLQGRLCAESGRMDRARAAFERARDEDVCPLRAPGRAQTIVRDVAAARGVSLVDFAVLADEWAAQGIPGHDLFFDHVHPTIDVHQRLALAIIGEMDRLGWAELSAGWSAEAVAEVASRIVEGLDPQTHALALMKLSKVLGWAGKLSESYRLGAQAAQLYPDDSRIQYNAGLTSHLIGRKPEAMAHYRRAVELQPDADQPHGNLGVLLQEEGRLDEAIEQFRLAIRYARSPETTRRNTVNLADALMRAGARDYRAGALQVALEKLGESANLAPGNPEILGQLGVAQLSDGRTEAAVANFERALAARPNDAALANRLALALVLDGQPDAAAKAYGRALELDPAVADLPDNVYVVLANMGRDDLAAEIRTRMGE